LSQPFKLLQHLLESTMFYWTVNFSPWETWVMLLFLKYCIELRINIKRVAYWSNKFFISAFLFFFSFGNERCWKPIRNFCTFLFAFCNLQKISYPLPFFVYLLYIDNCINFFYLLYICILKESKTRTLTHI